MGGFNILKTYPELLEILGLSETERYHDLQAIFKRDIEDNSCFAFRNRRIYPIKAQGEADMGAHPTNPVEGCADANPKTELPNDT